MMVDLKEKEIDVFVRFCKNRATNARSYDEVSMYVGLVEKLTNLKPQFKVRGKKGKKRTDASLKFHYPNSKKVEYHITHVKDGVIYGVRNKKLKLTLNEIVELKRILEKKDMILIYQDNWEQLAKQFDITVGAMQTYVFNIEIGTFDRWIKKFMDTFECQTTLDKRDGKNEFNTCTRSITG